MPKSMHIAKFIPPKSYQVLERARLYDLLAEKFQHQVTWISVPACAGTITLVLTYLQQQKIPPKWYQVDEGDNDLSLFLCRSGLRAKLNDGQQSPLFLLTEEYFKEVSVFTGNIFRRSFPGWLCKAC